MNFEATLAHAEQLDREDELAALRDQFHIPCSEDGREKIYFCGNSLGLQPKLVDTYIDEILKSWASNGVEGHFAGAHPWLPYHEFVTDKLANVVGAKPIEVVAMNSLTVNLHLMMVSFYRPTAQRFKILIERQAFPSDRYAVESQIRFHGFDPDAAMLEIAPRAGEESVRDEDLLRLIEQEGDRIVLIMLPGVQYYSGQAFDLAEITAAGHAKGCLVGFDLAHAAGNLPLALHDSGADFAVWCSYKYLNAGPGAVGGCFVHERHAKDHALPRFVGWWGHDKGSRFEMPDKLSLLSGAEGWQISNPQILSMAPLLASLDLFDRAGMENLTAKSRRLTGYLEFVLNRLCGQRLSIITPSDPSARGAQLSICVDTSAFEGKRIFERLVQAGFVCDWREPNVIRVAPVPLYNRFVDVYQFATSLQAML